MSRALDFTGLTLKSLIFDYLTDEKSMSYLLESITESMTSDKKRGTGNISKVLEPFKGLTQSAIFLMLNDDPYDETINEFEEKYSEDDISKTVAKNIIRIFKVLTGQSILNQLKDAPTKELAEQLKTKNIKLVNNKHDFADITKDLANANLTKAELFKILDKLYASEEVTVHTMFDTLQVKWGRIEMKTRNLTKSNVKEIVNNMEQDGWELIKEEPFDFKDSREKDTRYVGMKGLWYRLIDLNNEKISDIVNQIKERVKENQNNIMLLPTLRRPLGRILLGDEDSTYEEIEIDGQTSTKKKWKKIDFTSEKGRLMTNYHDMMQEISRSDVDLMYSIGGEKLSKPIFLKEKGSYEFNPIFFRIMYGNQSTVITNGLDTEFGKYLSKLTAPSTKIVYGAKVESPKIQDSLSRPKGNYSADEKDLLLSFYDKLKTKKQIPTNKKKPIFTDDDEEELKDKNVVSDKTIEAIRLLMESSGFLEFITEYNEDSNTNFNYTDKDPLTQALIFAHENKRLDVVGVDTDQMRTGDNLNNTLISVLRVAYKFEDGLVNIGDKFAKTKPNTASFEAELKKLEEGVVNVFSKLANDGAIIKGMNARLDEILSADLPQSAYERLEGKLLEEVNE